MFSRMGLGEPILLHARHQKAWKFMTVMKWSRMVLSVFPRIQLSAESLIKLGLQNIIFRLFEKYGIFWALITH